LVRFTLRDGRRDASIRMEMPEHERIQEIRETVEEYWGDGRVFLVRDFMVLDMDSRIGDSVDDDDVIDVVPLTAARAPKRRRRFDYRRVYARCMVGRLGTRADIIISESVLGKLLETMDSMLIETDRAGVLLGGDTLMDGNGRYYFVKGIVETGPIGICVASSEGGTEPTEEDLILFKKNMSEGMMMKADIYAHQFSFYKVSDTVEDATVLFQE